MDEEETAEIDEATSNEASNAALAVAAAASDDMQVVETETVAEASSVAEAENVVVQAITEHSRARLENMLEGVENMVEELSYLIGHDAASYEASNPAIANAAAAAHPSVQAESASDTRTQFDTAHRVYHNSTDRLTNMLRAVDDMVVEVSDFTNLIRDVDTLRDEPDATTDEAPAAAVETVAAADEAEASASPPPAVEELPQEAEPQQEVEPHIAEMPEDSASSDSISSDMSLGSPGSEDDSDIEAMPRWMIPANRVRSAVDMLVSQARTQDGGISSFLRRENFLQRVRSMVFSQDRIRNRVTNEANAVAEDTAEVETPPMDTEMNDDVRFDTNLPAEHSYFGNNLNRVPGVDYLEVGSTHRMLIFMHQHILFPGEVLPFMINGSIIDEEVNDAGRDGVIFGVGFPLMQPPDDNPHKLYGVTCQIYEKGESGNHLVFYKSRALQRIVINCDDIQGNPFRPPQYIARNPTMKCYSKVKILPEYFLPEPLKCLDMGSLNRFRDIPSMKDKFQRYQLTTTPWPLEACQEYSFEDIIEKARKKLEIHKIDTMPRCPIQLSFWLVRNLHLTEKMMRLTFLTNSVNTRLQLIGTTLKQESLFYCRYCNSSLASCSDLFAMSKHGVQTQYCNSGGYIHETNTVYRVISHAIGYSGEPSTEFSWFPGYQWHIIICKFCAQHVGWEFKAVEPNLAPKVFFGLAGSSVRIGRTSERTPTNNGSTFVVRNLMRLVSRELE
ncbi:protein cereblon isoform X1 [Drosophila albomicans]|uniref:Protein cereblon n=1 Tax=Drosophila albomicans TaxID=7291 RepID=A0A6P8XK31_DROAB|nr:protein cereblon isoform X1 [Drosophila albomicans]